MKKPNIIHLLNQLHFNYAYLIDLVQDVDDEIMTTTPSKGHENHPAFTIGHLITAYAMVIKKLGGIYSIDKEWDEIFRRKGPGDPRLPSDQKNLYPSKTELIDKLTEQHQLLVIFLNKSSAGQLNEDVTWRFNKYFPKTIDLLYFMCITHYSMHISQLAAWRRAMDLPSSLARL